jgi:hypothetical protein
VCQLTQCAHDTSLLAQVAFLRNGGNDNALLLQIGPQLVIEGSARFEGHRGQYSGAVNVRSGTSLTLMGDAVFANNTGDSSFGGGALAIEGDARVFLRGNTTFAGNSAPGSGGAISLLGYSGLTAALVVSGPFCMQNNTAGASGGGMYLRDATVQFEGPLAKQNMANNSPQDIFVDATDKSWWNCSGSLSERRGAGSYFVTGPPCACGDAAGTASGTTSTCGCAGLTSWSAR